MSLVFGTAVVYIQNQWKYKQTLLWKGKKQWKRKQMEQRGS